MRMTVLLLLLATASPVGAQTGPWQPLPTVGLGLGIFADGEVGGGAPGNGRIGLSGSYEVPLSTTRRVRVEAARLVLPTAESPRVTTDPVRYGTANVSRMTVSLAGLRSPGRVLSGYGGAGLGLYRASFKGGHAVQPGGHAYLGGELSLSDALAIDGELGAHLIHGPFYPGLILPVEALVRVKVALRRP